MRTGSVERKEKESPAREAPAKKKRTHVLSSSSSSSSGSEIIVTINSDDEFSLSSEGGREEGGRTRPTPRSGLSTRRRKGSFARWRSSVRGTRRDARHCRRQ